MKNTFFSILTLVLLSAVFTTSCKPGKDSPGRIFMPDMTYSNAYEAYASTKFQNQSDTDAISANLPREGTIPRGYFPDDEEVRNDESYMMSYMFKNYFENPTGNPLVDDNAQRVLAAEKLKNPHDLSDNLLKEGKKVYTVYCAVCHGKNGGGDGSIVVLEDGSDGPYSAIPPAFEGRLPGLTDGEIFYSISYGKNMMGGYFTQVSVSDRWKLVHYIKDLAGLNNVDVVEDDTTTVEEVVEGEIITSAE
jgi:mono/diheme cytochrome c family protein